MSYRFFAFQVQQENNASFAFDQISGLGHDLRHQTVQIVLLFEYAPGQTEQHLENTLIVFIRSVTTAIDRNQFNPFDYFQTHTSRIRKNYPRCDCFVRLNFFFRFAREHHSYNDYNGIMGTSFHDFVFKTCVILRANINEMLLFRPVGGGGGLFLRIHAQSKTILRAKPFNNMCGDAFKKLGLSLTFPSPQSSRKHAHSLVKCYENKTQLETT